MDETTIILLSGVTGSGKTTLARALQDILNDPARPFFHLEADRFLPYLPDDHPAWTQSEFRSAVSRALYRATAAFAREGHNLIVDGLLPNGAPELLDDCIRSLADFDLWLVGVFCALPTLEERESKRTDRTRGWARRQFSDLHAQMQHDVQVETTATSPAECALQIKRAIETGVKRR